MKIRYLPKASMSAARFVAFCKKLGIEINHDEAKRLHEAWLKRWPAMAATLKTKRS